METTYAMIGTDGQQYGPVTLAQIKSWVLEGRIGGETQVWRSDTNSWLPAAQYVELGLASPVPPAVPPGVRTPSVIRSPAADGNNLVLERRALRSARWFYWIAVLSLINTFIAASGQGVVFLVGLAVTQYIYYFSAQLGSGGNGVGIVLSAVVAGLFAMLGFFASKRNAWAFIVGIVLYAGDALLAMPAGDWLSVGFHVFVLYLLFLGLKANGQLKSASPGGMS
ncbi:MAG TPA: DUF4339 domain-containing protein [Verrucomicrobiae bacterium]|jgi:hypothetical protein|nr:DUF4339 domain-containing protein [Verrucomicrobiae bacterium]